MSLDTFERWVGWIGAVDTLVTLAIVLVGLAMQRIPMWGSWLAVIITPGLLAQALIIAVTLGAVGGMYPAWRAANLSPVEALRYE